MLLLLLILLALYMYLVLQTFAVKLTAPMSLAFRCHGLVAPLCTLHCLDAESADVCEAALQHMRKRVYLSR
jgi:hypothetical protein